MQINTSCDLVIFGAKGDLSRRKLLPSLYKLEKYKKIHKNTRIIGAARADWNIQDYIKIVKTAIKTFLDEKIDKTIWKKFSSRLSFCNIDAYKQSHFLKLKNILSQNNNIVIYYCAVPPNILNPIFTGLKNENLNLFPSRIILEKPLGVSLETSQEINNKISEYFLESQIFRIDHYLGKESILNLLALRFSNLFFLKNWDNTIIDHVQITVSEEVGIEERWNYFDQMGQMKDMVQNHLLQILTMITMNPPQSLSSQHIQYEKIKILQALDPININNIHLNTVRGQYSSGMIKGKKVPSYIEEPNANKYSQTETFVAIKAHINTKKWLGVPFYLRTGKRLAQKYSEVVVVFKKAGFNLFSGNENFISLQNKLIIRLETNESIKMNFFSKAPGLDKEYKLQKSHMKCNYFEDDNFKNFISAYERLLLETMRGVQYLFVSRNEVEEAWKWIDPIITAWKKSENNMPQLYACGTWGPKDADLIISQDNRYWHQFNEKEV